MGALDVIFRLLKPGDEIIAGKSRSSFSPSAQVTRIGTLIPNFILKPGNDLYGGSNRLLTYLRTHNGIVTHHVDTTIPSTLLPYLKPTSPSTTSKVKLVLLESPTNPLLQIADIQAISALVHEHVPEAVVVVDNTMMSPYLQRPLEYGADIVYDSGTKYLSGHHDLMAGVIVCDRDDLAKVRSQKTNQDPYSTPGSDLTPRFLAPPTANRIRDKLSRERPTPLRLIPPHARDQNPSDPTGQTTIHRITRSIVPPHFRVQDQLPRTTRPPGGGDPREAGERSRGGVELRDWG